MQSFLFNFFLNFIQLYTKFTFLVSTMFYSLIHHPNQKAHDRIRTRETLDFMASFLTLSHGRCLRSVPRPLIWATKDGTKVFLRGEMSWKEGQAGTGREGPNRQSVEDMEEAMSTWE